MYNFASLIIDRMEERKLSRTAQVVSKTMYEAMRLLAASGGPMTVTQLREQIAQKLEFTEWEQQSPSTKTQQSRWAINMTYYVFDYIKADLMFCQSIKTTILFQKIIIPISLKIN